jgi:hypothetical protein
MMNGMTSRSIGHSAITLCRMDRLRINTSSSPMIAGATTAEGFESMAISRHRIDSA